MLDFKIDNVAHYLCDSLSEPHKPPHKPIVDLDTGIVDCNCGHFTYHLFPDARKAGETVDIGAVKYHCDHISLAIADCIRRGDIVLNV